MHQPTAAIQMPVLPRAVPSQHNGDAHAQDQVWEKVAIIKTHHHAAAAQDAVVCDQLLSDNTTNKGDRMRIMATGVDGRTSRACLMNSSSSSGRKALKAVLVWLR